jgi:hypothetical protein
MVAGEKARFYGIIASRGSNTPTFSANTRQALVSRELLSTPD